ncbi:MAG: hypothetical protein V1936_04585 [Patescibacteria group bacterium]
MTVLKVTLLGADRENARNDQRVLPGIAQKIANLFNQEGAVVKLECSARLGAIGLVLHPGVMNSTIKEVLATLRSWGMTSEVSD